MNLHDIYAFYDDKENIIIHRLIEINDDGTYTFKGDANENNDRFPVLYSQMTGIYKNERIPFVGSFVLFLQSPAGYLCILLIIASLIVIPLAEKSLDKRKENRLASINFIDVKKDSDEHE